MKLKLKKGKTASPLYMSGVVVVVAVVVDAIETQWTISPLTITLKQSCSSQNLFVDIVRVNSVRCTHPIIIACAHTPVR
jgi:hypothetical protein